MLTLPDGMIMETHVSLPEITIAFAEYEEFPYETVKL